MVTIGMNYFVRENKEEIFEAACAKVGFAAEADGLRAAARGAADATVVGVAAQLLSAVRACIGRCHLFLSWP